MKDTPSGGDSSRRLLSALAIVVVVVIAFLLGRATSDGSTPESPEPAAAPTADPGPTQELNGVPGGYARTEEGAIAAATNFQLLSGKDNLLEGDALERAMVAMAAPSWKKEAARQAQTGYEYVVDTYGADAEVSTAVLRYDLAKFSTDRAVVQLWTVSVLSGSSRPTVDEVWGVVTVDLQWVDDDWRVAGVQSRPGPSPVGLPSNDSRQSARSLMEDFRDIERLLTP